MSKHFSYTKAGTRQDMQVTEIIGKSITNIYASIQPQADGRETAECWIELDNALLVAFPFDPDDNIQLMALPTAAVSLFRDITDYPVYYINKGSTSIHEMIGIYQHDRLGILNKIRQTSLEFRHTNAGSPHRIEHKETRLKNIRNRKIINFAWYPGDNEKGFFLLDNGYLVSETTTAPQGTGLAGINVYNNISDLTKEKDSLRVLLRKR